MGAHTLISNANLMHSVAAVLDPCTFYTLRGLHAQHGCSQAKMAALPVVHAHIIGLTGHADVPALFVCIHHSAFCANAKKMRVIPLILCTRHLPVKHS